MTTMTTEPTTITEDRKVQVTDLAAQFKAAVARQREAQRAMDEAQHDIVHLKQLLLSALASTGIDGEVLEYLSDPAPF